jgi:hypothetical protein
MNRIRGLVLCSDPLQFFIPFSLCAFRKFVELTRAELLAITLSGQSAMNQHGVAIASVKTDCACKYHQLKQLVNVLSAVGTEGRRRDWTVRTQQSRLVALSRKRIQFNRSGNIFSLSRALAPAKS